MIFISEGGGSEDWVAGVRLSLEERDDIAAWRDLKVGIREIARRLGRAPSTISRELRRPVESCSRRRYRALPAHICAQKLARRSQPRKLVAGSALRAEVARLLRLDYSPGQIAGRLKREYPGQPEMHVSHETIYQALFVQGKGSLRAEIDAAVRCGQARRRRRRSRALETRGKVAGMINISQRPAEADDRAVPGHWEGDLIIGTGGKSAVITLAERSSRFCLILALPPGDHGAAAVSAALTAKITTLPAALRRSLAWDCGKEMSRHAAFTVATGLPVYFADPHSPWQRGTNENTNGLIRYYYPKTVTDFTAITQAELDQTAHKLNTRPRRTLSYRTPAEALNQLLVATTT